MRNIRFGFTLSTPTSRADLTETIRVAEDFGYDIAVTVDHLGAGRTSPFQGALAAAMISDTMRVGTFVLNTAFWNPTVLTREVATIQRLSGNRFELGLGLGVVKAQFDAAGIPWLTHSQRLARVAATATEIAAQIAQDATTTMPRLLIGGTGHQTLRMAAEHADIVSLGGTTQVPGSPPGTLRVMSGAEARDRLTIINEACAGRDIERNIFVQEVVVTDDRRAAAEKIAAEYGPGLTVQGALDSPHLLLGTSAEIAEQVVRIHEEYGFTSFYVQRPWLDELGPSIKLALAA